MEYSKILSTRPISDWLLLWLQNLRMCLSLNEGKKRKVAYRGVKSDLGTMSGSDYGLLCYYALFGFDPYKWLLA